MAITRRTKLYLKRLFPKNGNLSGKFYAEIGDSLWDVTQEVFELYCAKAKNGSVDMQCFLHRGTITSVAVAIDQCKIKVTHLDNVYR